MLSSCANVPGANLRGVLRGRRLKQPPPGSTGKQPPRFDESGLSPSSSSPQAGAEFLEDPDGLEDFPTFIDPRAGFLQVGGGFGTGAANFEMEDGTIHREPKIPLDLKLIEAIRGKHKDSFVGDLIVGLSKATARLLRIEEETVSEHLAVKGNTTINAVHLRMLQPVLKGAPGPITSGVGQFLKDIADVSLLESSSDDIATRDRGLRDLEKQVEVLDSGFDVPFFSTSTEREKDVYERIRGNLEIARIERQEEF